jgi:hypothetical protein
MADTMLVVDKGEFGFEPLIVVFAESLGQAPWWRYHTLIQGDNSDKLGVADPDFFCVYNFSTKKIVWMLSHTPSRGGFIFRIHNGVKARFTKRDDASAGVVATGGFTGFDGVHQCTGKAHLGCKDEVTVKFDTDHMAFTWVLPAHFKYESKKDIQWAAP